MSDLETAFEDLQLDVLAKSRQDRLKEHCVKMTDALLHRSEPLKDVCFKCSDDEFQFAHKFVLGTQCQYFRTTLYREGIMDVSTNSIKGKKYRFTSSSQCFKSVAEFLYTGKIRAIAQADGDIDGVLSHAGELLALAKQPSAARDGMGGLAPYLTACFCRTPPRDICAAMQRLGIALKSNVQDIVDATVAAIPALPFKRDAFASVGPEVVELVLRDVPLNATEIEVWRAVKAWADEFFDDLSDPDFSPSCSPREEEVEPVVPEALKGILKCIDLACINWQEVCQEILPLKLFDDAQVQAARRTHAVNRTGMEPSRPSQRRGKAQPPGTSPSAAGSAPDNGL